MGIGAPDPSLTGVPGMVVVTELVDRLNMIRLLDVAIGPIKARDRGRRTARWAELPRSRYQ